MTVREAKNIGQGKILKGTSPIVPALLLIFVLIQAPHNFYDGFLMLFLAITSIHFYFILLILLVLSYILGGVAGKEIIVDKKNYYIVSLKYAALIIATLTIYLAILGKTDESLKDIIFSYSGICFIPLLGTWLLAAYKMKTQKDHQK